MLRVRLSISISVMTESRMVYATNPSFQLQTNNRGATVLPVPRIRQHRNVHELAHSAMAILQEIRNIHASETNRSLMPTNCFYEASFGLQLGKLARKKIRNMKSRYAFLKYQRSSENIILTQLSLNFEQ
jgi:hypothetical protein